jgi:hypothetical protein
MSQTTWTKRRTLWMVGVGLAGFFIGGIGGGPKGSVLGLIWGASIGWGFGSIFELTHATNQVVLYWGATMALVGPFFGLIVGAAFFPYDSVVQEVIAGGIGAAAGMLFGSLIGIVQLKRLRRRSQTPPLSASA